MIQAYRVTDLGEDIYTIAFGETPEAAIEQGASELQTESECCEADRAPEWDEYASLGYVPPAVLIEIANWRFDCWKCDREVSWDCGFVVEDEDCEVQPIEPVFIGKAVFCCARCHQEWQAGKARSKARKEEAIARLTKRFPGITNVKANCCGGDSAVYVSFRAGSCAGDIGWRSDTPDSVMVEFRDTIPWREFMEARNLTSDRA